MNDHANDFAEAERDDGKVIAFQAKRGNADREASDRGRDAAEQERAEKDRRDAESADSAERG